MTNQYIRRQTIGGSDIYPVVFGMDRFGRTDVDVWLEIREGDSLKQETAPMHWGKMLESIVIQEYTTQEQCIHRYPGVIISEKFPHLHGTPDGVIQRNIDGAWVDAHLLEVKTTSAFNRVDDHDLPNEWVAQANLYLGLTGFKSCDFAILRGGNDFQIKRVFYNQDLFDLMAEKSAEWYAKYITGNEVPACKCLDDAEKIWNFDNGEIIDATDEIEDLVARIKMYKESIKQYEKMIEEYELSVKKFMGEFSSLRRDGKILATWKLSSPSRRVDTKRVPPEYYTDFPGSRRFSLK